MDKKPTTNRLLAQVKPVTTRLLTAFTQTHWAILTSIVAGVVTTSIYCKGAPQMG